MKKMFFLLAAMAAAVGCRRSDWREYTFSTPDLTAAKTGAVVRALSAYGGVDLQAISFAQNLSSVRVRFDSMKVARENLRQAMASVAVAVPPPELIPGAPAGYINARAPEIEP